MRRLPRGATFADVRVHGSASFGGATFQKAAFFEGSMSRIVVPSTLPARRSRAPTSLPRGSREKFRLTTHVSLGGHGSTMRRSRRRLSSAEHRFRDDADFSGVTFSGDARFSGAEFARNGDFQGTHFKADAWFNDARFAGAAVFSRTKFDAIAAFHDTFIAGSAEFPFATFASRDLTGMQVGGRLSLHASVARIVSLRRTDVSNLVLSDVDLRACRFYGAHNLDRLRLEGAARFAVTPPLASSWARGADEPAWLWSRRQVLAEEHEWRSRDASPEKRADWHPPECRLPQWLIDSPGPKPEALEPHQIAPLYRALRKGREDSRDEPGAAGFYYGEMEMRRHSSATPQMERALLTLYWLVSGYGLRGSRALVALVLCVAVAAVAFHAWGSKNASHSCIRSFLVLGARSASFVPPPRN
jgi:uncharacterized protein YjbI with pentapeptide repeats